MIVLELKYFRAIASDYYHKKRDGIFMIPAKALMVPLAADGATNAIRHFKDTYDVDLIFSDIFRSPYEQAKLRKRNPRIAALPGGSGHNWGISIDLHTNRIFAQFRIKDIPYKLRDLQNDLFKFGFTSILSERWHFNFLSGRRTVRQVVQEDFLTRSAVAIGVSEIQECLSSLGYYNLEVDGDYGPSTINSVEAFQKDFCLLVDGKAGPITKRTLVVVTMNVKLTQ